MRILVVEDEPRMLELLARGLYEHGFTVMTAANGEAGLRMARESGLDAMVLDWGLPDMDGTALARTLRAEGVRTPILMLTARDREDDIIHGLEVGADDYLTKPFSFPELVARLQSILRRQRMQSDEIFDLDGLVIDARRHTARRDARPIDLSRQEFQLLLCLARRAGQCVARQVLLECVWGSEPAVSAGALDVLISSVRSKMECVAEQKRIVTVRGSGYMLRRKRADRGAKE